MKFSAQEEYGLRCILQLARATLREAGAMPVGSDGSGAAAGEPVASGGPSVTVAEIARLEGLTQQYAGKLFSILVKAGLVESVRGRGGGVRLTDHPARINVATVLTALGGAFYQEETCDRFKGDRNFCVHSNDCSIRSLWSGLQLMINSVLTRTSLQDLCAGEQTMSHWMKRHEEAFESFQPIAEFQLGQRD